MNLLPVGRSADILKLLGECLGQPKIDVHHLGTFVERAGWQDGKKPHYHLLLLILLI